MDLTLLAVCVRGGEKTGSQSANWEGDPFHSGISVSGARRFILCKSQYL